MFYEEDIIRWDSNAGLANAMNGDATYFWQSRRLSSLHLLGSSDALNDNLESQEQDRAMVRRDDGMRKESFRREGSWGQLVSFNIGKYATPVDAACVATNVDG